MRVRLRNTRRLGRRAVHNGSADQQICDSLRHVTPAPSLAASLLLVVLLRDRPGGRTWTELTAQVRESGSARAVHDHLLAEGLVEEPTRTLIITGRRPMVKLYNAA